MPTVPFSSQPLRNHPWPAARRAAGLGLLVLALLWAQLLGLAHGVRHAGAAAGGSVPVAAAAEQGVLGHLAAAADDGPDCRLYDQIGHAGPIAVPPVWALALPPQLWRLGQDRSLPAAVCAPYAARAPPSAR